MNLLEQEEFYGYLLIVKIKECTGFDIAEGTIYPILNRLNSEGLVEYKWIEQKTGIPRKYYSLSGEGKKTLRELNLNWNEIITDISKQIR